MRKLILPLIAAGAFSVAGCASNYTGEGALAGGALGAVGGAIAGDTAAGAAIGAAAGAAVGSQVNKDDGCYRYNRNGDRYWDRNCR